MERLSVNGVLLPVDNNILIDSNNQPIEDPYIGHFMQVIYIQEIETQNVFGKDRVDVEGDGQFRFFIPTNLADNEMVTIEIYAPDGELLGKQRYSSESLKGSAISVSTEDTSEELKIKLNPKIIAFDVDSPTTITTKTIRGKVIDISGERKASNLQIIIFISNNSDTSFDINTFESLFTTTTDVNGYFTAKIDNTQSVKSAFGLIAGLEANPIEIKPENNKLPKDILLVTDLRNLPDALIAMDTIPTLPDNDELATSSVFSQDLGGTCVDFTIPNRTLEEFSFYHTVRTTEPEIRGLTITPSDGQKITDILTAVSNNAFIVFTRLNTSFKSLSIHQFSAEEEQKEFVSNTPSESTEKNLTKPQNTFRSSLALKFSAINITKPINISANLSRFILPDFNKVTIALEQARRRAKLHELQQKLTAAYCGLKGASEAKTYCEELTSNATLNREEISSLLGDLARSKPLLEMDAAVSQVFDDTLFELEKFINLQNVNDNGLNNISKKLEKLLTIIETETKKSQAQENLLTSLRKIIIEISSAKGKNTLPFAPCPSSDRSDTMGIICLMQEFEKIKTTLKNTSILSLGEIIKIEEYYNIFLTSLRTFLTLLEEFYTFYRSSIRLSVALIDNYFIEEYDNIKNTLGSLNKQIQTALTSINKTKRAYIENHPGRVQLSVERSIDWDETPTVYENTTIAHGHILHFKQKWKADGYSLGTLLYSLPLGPCQEKQIAILDWDRQEKGDRREAQDVSEALQAEISRNRDITDIINSSLRESMNATSNNETSSTSAGIGGGIGGFIGNAVFGLAGGVAHSGASSNSNASQNSARNLTASSLNRLRDNTSQSASSLRSQRSTVIQVVDQKESVSAQTEVIKNNNHCHAITIEYFEVLKHYALEEELVDAQECLYVPLPMSHFNHAKIMRWKDTLRRSVYGRKFGRGFDAIERKASEYVNSDFPDGSFADEVIEEFTGHFDISFELRRPNIPEIDEATKTIRYNLEIEFPWYVGGGSITIPLEKDILLSESEKDAIFEKEFAPDIVRTFIDTLDVFALADNGDEELLDLDVTLLSNYRRGTPLKVSIASNSRQKITRKQIKHIRFRANTNVKASSKIILRSVYLHYRTKHLNEYIIRNSRVNNDIINTVEIEVELGFPPSISIETKTDAALLYTPLNKSELRNPKQEDSEAASALVDFLNEHLEKSHKIIWSRMDNSRLFGLLDGYIAPNARGRSVASVVENKIMGIVGNNLVLKVVPGERLDPVFRNVDNLLEYYKPTTKPDPYRISVPTKGVYAESVMGKCNSCEKIDETRHWRFEDVPCGTKPTAIDPLSTASRRSDPGNLQPKNLPTNLINLQNAPAAPDPTGLAAAFGLLGKGDIFKDITGLAGTQANALGALQTTSKSVTDLASISKDFANLAVMANQKSDGAKQIEQIKKLNKDGILNDEETKEQIKKVLDSTTDAAKSISKNEEDEPISPEEVQEMAKTSNEHDVVVEVENKAGKYSTKPNKSTPKRKAKKDIVIAFDISDNAALPMNGLINADIQLLLPDSDKQAISTLITDDGFSSETVNMDVTSGDRGQLHVKFFSAHNPYKQADSSDDIDESFSYRGNETFVIPSGDAPLVFQIRLKYKEYTIISTSKQEAIEAISSSNKITKGGKIYAEAEGGLPFISKIKGGIEVSTVSENATTIIDTKLEGVTLGTSFKMKIATGGLLIEQK